MRLGCEEDYIAINGHKIYVDAALRAPLLAMEEGDSAGLLVENNDTDIDVETVKKLITLKQFEDMQGIPGIIAAVGLPDIHAGYAFPVGSVAAVDLGLPEAGISPEGIGFDINCGVRCVVTDLMLDDIKDSLESIADVLADAVPSGLGDASGSVPGGMQTLNQILDNGLLGVPKEMMEVMPEDIENTESKGSLPGNSRLINQQAKAKGLAQIGSLGSGNHYLEIQAVDTIIDSELANALGLKHGQIIVSIHTGSRGLGHAACSKFMKDATKAKEDAIKYQAERKGRPDLQKDGTIESAGDISYVPYHSVLGQNYLSIMYSAANYAWVNRTLIACKVKKAFLQFYPNASFGLLYDASHNIAKIEEFELDGEKQSVLVHRKGAARALPPRHHELPTCYYRTGQPIPVGGSMGTSSYILVGGKESFKTFYSTCHGAGRILSRSTARTVFTYGDVVADLNSKGIVFRGGSQAGLIEEACGCYKDVDNVVAHSAKVGIVQIVVKLKPIIVIKG